jgi:DNA-directed RNA polymerase subunit RPC12/RpoP
MPATTCRQSQREADTPSGQSEAGDVVRMEFEDGDERLSFPFPPTNLTAPNTIRSKDDEKVVHDMQMGAAKVPSQPKVDSVIDEGIEEDSTKGVSKAEVDTSGHPNEQEMINTLYRSEDEYDGMAGLRCLNKNFCTYTRLGIQLTEQAFYGDSEEEMEVEGPKEDSVGIRKAEEEESDGGVELEEDSDTASTTSEQSRRSVASYHSAESHHSIEMNKGNVQPSSSFPRPPSAYHRDDNPPRQSLNDYHSMDDSPFAETSEPSPIRWQGRYRCAGRTKPCGVEVDLSDQDTTRCKECGCHGLYKLRTKRMVQFEAR